MHLVNHKGDMKDYFTQHSICRPCMENSEDGKHLMVKAVWTRRALS